MNLKPDINFLFDVDDVESLRNLYDDLVDDLSNLYRPIGSDWAKDKNKRLWDIIHPYLVIRGYKYSIENKVCQIYKKLYETNSI